MITTSAIGKFIESEAKTVCRLLAFNNISTIELS
jgi:hypothetical protein